MVQPILTHLHICVLGQKRCKEITTNTTNTRNGTKNCKELFVLGDTQNNQLERGGNNEKSNSKLAQCAKRRAHCTKLPSHPLDGPAIYNEIVRMPNKVNSEPKRNIFDGKKKEASSDVKQRSALVCPIQVVTKY